MTVFWLLNAAVVFRKLGITFSKIKTKFDEFLAMRLRYISKVFEAPKGSSGGSSPNSTKIFLFPRYMIILEGLTDMGVGG